MIIWLIWQAAGVCPFACRADDGRSASVAAVRALTCRGSLAAHYSMVKVNIGSEHAERALSCIQAFVATATSWRMGTRYRVMDMPSAAVGHVGCGAVYLLFSQSALGLVLLS